MQMRQCIEQSFSSVCEYRGWQLHALHCRTNHAHVVVSADASIERVVHDLKAYATRALRRDGLADATQPVWASHASMRYLFTEIDVAAAVEYTLESQGADLPGTRVWEDHRRGD
jgi:REP element-mobilizing transposase RayT